MRPRSSSATSSSSSTPSLSPDNIPIYVKVSGGKTIPLNVRPHHTIETVLSFLSASEAFPRDVRLLYAGHNLNRQSTISDSRIEPQATLHLLIRLRGGTGPEDPQPPVDIPTNNNPKEREMAATLPNPAETASPSAPILEKVPTPPPQDHEQPLLPEQLISKPATPIPSSSGTSTPTSSTARSGTSTPKPKSNRPRCLKSGCKAPAQPIVGDCGFCAKRFCGKHRMLEAHECEGLADARQADKDRNTAKLEGERTVMLRGL